MLKTQAEKFLCIVVNYSNIENCIRDKCSGERKCHAIFHYRVKNENPYLSFSMPSAYSNFAAGDYWLGGYGSVTAKWETTHCDNGDLRALPTLPSHSCGGMISPKLSRSV